MVPCPSALVVLLTSIAFDIALIGLILIFAFSLGLAMVLVGIGVFMVLAGSVTARVGGRGRRIAGILPFVSGTAVTLVGAGVTWKGLAALGVVELPAWLGPLAGG
jgi:ABC-type nickel/cobalt efflux system permease component RcnA